MPGFRESRIASITSDLFYLLYRQSMMGLLYPKGCNHPLHLVCGIVGAGAEP
jgi:hypothetical protein